MDFKDSKRPLEMTIPGNKIKIRHRLLTRLLVSHILIASLPLFFTGKVLVDSAKDSIEQTVLERNFELTKRATQLIAQKVDIAKEVIRNQANNPAIYELNKSSLDLAIQTMVSEFDLFSKIMILDTLSKVVATTSFEQGNRAFVSSDGIVSNVLQGLGYQSEVYLSRENLPMLDVVEPLEQFGEVVGVLFAVVDLKAMWDLVLESVIGERGEAFVFDRRGVFIAHSDRKNVYLKNQFTNQRIVDEINQGRNGRLIYQTDEKVEMVAAYAPIGDYGWGFMIQQPTSEAFAQAESMRLRIFQFMFGTIFLASLLAYIYTRWMVIPVDHLVSGMDRFSKGELNLRIERATNDEIGALAENFNEMAERISEYQNTVKRTERLETLGKLAAVLSHEIRNPLNSMVINMQILRRESSKEVVNRERVDNFYKILESEIERVDQLVKDFLLIARPLSLQKSQVALNEILDEVITMRVAESLKKGVRIERDYDKIPFYANVDEAKIKQVFLNLIINALQAMPGGGKLVIGISKTGEKAKLNKKSSERPVCITFKDTGTGIKKENLNKIFDFYYSTKKDGSGLGLAIVQQIVEEHQGSIKVESKLSGGTTVTLCLPQY
ncbi:MAG: ATP-binding protein [bacterium]